MQSASPNSTHSGSGRQQALITYHSVVDYLPQLGKLSVAASPSLRSVVDRGPAHDARVDVSGPQQAQLTPSCPTGEFPVSFAQSNEKRYFAQMKPEPPNARNYIRDLAASGRYSFTSHEAQAALGVSANATKVALYRLIREGEIASPARGFYVIVPPEYRSLGCLPADQFIPNLMQQAGLPYYAGLLTAAQYYGAAHHRPQEFHVMLAKPRRPIHCGLVRVKFFVRKRLREVPLQSFNTPRGTIHVSTPETTALDLVGYQHQVGGLDHVATVLSELAEQIDPQKLAATAPTAPLPWAQRLGYLLEQAGAAEKTEALKAYVKKTARETVALLPGAHGDEARRDAGWKLIVNVDVEVEM